MDRIGWEGWDGIVGWMRWMRTQLEWSKRESRKQEAWDISSQCKRLCVKKDMNRLSSERGGMQTESPESCMMASQCKCVRNKGMWVYSALMKRVNGGI